MESMDIRAGVSERGQAGGFSFAKAAIYRITTALRLLYLTVENVLAQGKLFGSVDSQQLIGVTGRGSADLPALAHHQLGNIG